MFLQLSTHLLILTHDRFQNSFNFTLFRYMGCPIFKTGCYIDLLLTETIEDVFDSFCRWFSIEIWIQNLLQNTIQWSTEEYREKRERTKKKNKENLVFFFFGWFWKKFVNAFVLGDVYGMRVRSQIKRLAGRWVGKAGDRNRRNGPTKEYRA